MSLIHYQKNSKEKKCNESTMTNTVILPLNLNIVTHLQNQTHFTFFEKKQKRAVADSFKPGYNRTYPKMAHPATRQLFATFEIANPKNICDRKRHIRPAANR